MVAPALQIQKTTTNSLTNDDKEPDNAGISRKKAVNIQQKARRGDVFPDLPPAVHCSL